MRDYQTKANQGGAPDSITSTKLGAGETNSFLTEAKTAVSRAGLTPADADGAGEDTTQLAQALFINAVKASSFLDSGSANAYQLTPVSGSAGVLLPGGYGALDGMRIYFVPSANNTGNTTINIGQTVGTLLGSKKALTLAGGEIPSGALLASRLTSFTYDASADSGTGAWILDGSYGASGQFLPLTGGTMTGAIAMGNNKVTGLAAGTVSGDAVHKGQTASTTDTGLVELATNAETQTGTDTARTVTPAGLQSRTFVSAQFAITGGSAGTTAHGLSGTVRKVEAYFVCLTAEGGFSPGDYVAADLIFTSTSNEFNPMVWVRGANVGYLVGGAGCLLWDISNPLQNFTLTPANWRFVIVAEN